MTSHNDLGESLDVVAFKIDKYVTLQKNWDSYGGEPITSTSIQTAKGIMRRVHAETGLVPQPVPTSKGGVQLEYFPKQYINSIEVEIEPDGKHVDTLLMDDTTEYEGITIENFLENIHKYLGLPREDQTIY